MPHPPNESQEELWKRASAQVKAENDVSEEPDADVPSTAYKFVRAVFLAVVVILIIAFAVSSPNSGSPPPAAAPVPVSQVEPYGYSIIGRRDISYLNTPRMVMEVRLDTPDLPTEERMRETARIIWLPEATRWKALTVFMIFGELEDFSFGAYAIAEFTPNGLEEFRTNDNPLTMLRLKKSGAFDGLETPKP